MAKYLDGTGLGQLWTAIKSGFISTGGGVISGKLTVTAPSTGETEINQNLEAITIAPKQTRNGAAGVYYPGIAFNHMIGYNNSTYYNIGTQAWIGIKLHSTPGSELSYLVFATKPGTGVSGTGNDRPIERMNIAPDGTVKVLGDLYSGKFIKTGSTDAYVLLGAGGTKAVSDFATSDHTHSYIPTSSESTFVHKTGSETITGQKNFSTSTNTVPLIISRDGSANNENLKIGVDDGTVHFLHTQDETVADFLFTSTVTDTERAEGKGTNAASHNIRLALGYNRSAIYLDDTYTVIHSGNYTSYVNTTNFPGLNKIGTVTSVSTGTGLTGGDITSTGTISINSTYQSYISHGETAYGWGNHANGGYVKTTTDQSISGAKTFSDLRVNNIPQDTAMPFFLGIEAFADGGRVKWVSKDDTKVGYATTAGSANSVAWGNISGKPDTYTPASHTHSYLFTEQISANQSGISWAQGYATTNPKSFVYNTNGAEYSYLVGMNTNNNYGTILKMGYTDKYLRILRKSGGAWQSEDWEKIWAGYADSAGSASSVAWSNVSSKPDTATRWPAWSEVTGKPDTFTPSSHNHNSSYTYKFSHTLPTQKGVRITFSPNATVLISVCGSNSGAQLVIIGTGYGEGGRVRNQFTELVSCSLFDWCIPDSNSISCSVEIFSRRDSNSIVWVQSPENVSFTEIDALTSAKENATLLTSKNYNSWAAAVGHNHSGVYSEVGHTHNYLPLSGGTLTASTKPVLILNDTGTNETGIRFDRNGTAKGWVGYHDTNGVYLYNSARGKYLNYKDDGSLLFEGNTVYHSGNLPAYPTKASWNYDDVYVKIADIGNQSVSFSTSSGKLKYTSQLTTKETLDSFHEGGYFKVTTWNGNSEETSLGTSYPGANNGIILDGGWTSASYGFQLAIDDDPNYFIALRQRSGNGWNAWKKIPMADGTNASGSWGISITGNAATATTATTANSVAWSNVSGKPDTFTPSSHSHSEYLPRNTNSSVLPQFSGTPEYLLGIEPFANNGTVKWQSASSVNVGYATSAGTWTTARTLTIGNTGKSVNGSGNVSWSLAEIGAQAAGNYVTTDTNQVITGIKNFNTNTNTAPLRISRGGTTQECLSIGCDDSVAYFHFMQDERYASYKFTGEWDNSEAGDTSLSGSKYIQFNLNGYEDASISINGATAIHTSNISPSLPINGNQIAVKAGGVTSGYITVPYSTNSGTATTSTVLLTNNTSQNADACYNEAPGLRFWRYNGTSSTTGQSGGDGWILSWSWNSGSVGGQIYLDDNPSRTMCIRGRNNDANKTFTTWATFLHTLNHTSLTNSEIDNIIV